MKRGQSVREENEGENNHKTIYIKNMDELSKECTKNALNAFIKNREKNKMSKTKKC